MVAARGNRWGHRDATAILIAYRHGLRASELVALRWDDIELATGRMQVRRVNYAGRVPLTIRTTQISKHAPIKPAIDRRIDESNPPSSQAPARLPYRGAYEFVRNASNAFRLVLAENHRAFLRCLQAARGFSVL